MNGHRECGVTLLEMLVAMAIMAMVGALTFPALDNAIAALTFRGSIDLMERDLYDARAAAIVSQRPVIVTSSRDGQTYGQTGMRPRRAPAGISFAIAPSAIVFFGDGSSSGGALVIQRSAQRALISVDSTTGAVAVRAR
ncbi:MAG TPA: GspH/FimT family pseudopilin [Rhizomicrobium sp.]|jgi:general secretion pathway protein H